MRAGLWSACRHLYFQPASHGTIHLPFTRFQHISARESRLPRVIQPSTWSSIIPKALRNRKDQSSTPVQKKSNPANYFIWIYILIGSQAIRILQVKNEFNTFMRQADQQLAKLREVIERLQRGEKDVDVEKILGTGDEEQERLWEEALKELESEERLWQNNKQERRAAKKQALQEKQDASPVNGDGNGDGDGEGNFKPMRGVGRHKAEAIPQAPGFY